MMTLAELTSKAAGMYLQSAVFIDDEIFSLGRPVERKDLPQLRERKLAFVKAEDGNGGTGGSGEGAKPAEGGKLEVAVEAPVRHGVATTATSSSGVETAKAVTVVESQKAGDAGAGRKGVDPAMTVQAGTGGAGVSAGAAGQAAFHPREIVASFAKKGVVCALYEPATDFKTDEDSEVFKLCQAADLLILDWDFHKDEGARMRDLVVALVEQSRRVVPHHSRLVVIYTTTPSLAKAASGILDGLEKAGMKPAPADGGLRMDVEATRIVVLGKVGIERSTEETAFTVSEEKLADRVLDEFVRMNVGILPALALLGMAAVKRNSRRILAKFSPDMDGAFLLNRALVSHSEEAFDLLPPLMVEEFLAVVQDQFGKVGELSGVVSERVTGMTIAYPDKAWSRETETKNEEGRKVTAQVTQEEFAAVARALLTQGVKGLKDYKNFLEVKKLSTDWKSLARGVDADLVKALRKAVDAGGKQTSERLAALFNARTYYDQQARILTLGTIVRLAGQNGGEAEHWVCVVPVCDALRLKSDQPYDFPFLRLWEGISGQRGGAGCVVEDIKQALVELVAPAKIRDLRIQSFTPRNGAGVVIAERDGAGFWLVADDGKRYEWVGQLKAAHAQRLANNVGQALSRVGLSEAEWVRVMCERG
jgi:hypothetical protein